MTKSVRIIYHHEDGAWWAVSPELPDVIAAGDSQAEVRQLVDEGLAGEDYEIEHLDADSSEYQAPEGARFLADLGRVAGPLLMVQGFKIENLETAGDVGEIVATSSDDITYA